MTLMRSLREATRHYLGQLGLRRTKEEVVTGSVAERFATIYDKGLWRVGRSDVPASGEGSTLEATEELRRALPGLLAELECRTLVDIGCGDFHWMQHVPLACDYVGLDIVPSVIAANEASYGGPQRRFAVADAIRDPLPAADVILCREMLFHLSFADGLAALANMKRSGARWLMLTSDVATLFNADIETGGARILNLERGPFGFPAPARKIEEPKSYPGRYIGVWPISVVTG